MALVCLVENSLRFTPTAGEICIIAEPTLHSAMHSAISTSANSSGPARGTPRNRTSLRPNNERKIHPLGPAANPLCPPDGTSFLDTDRVMDCSSSMSSSGIIGVRIQVQGSVTVFMQYSLFHSHPHAPF